LQVSPHRRGKDLTCIYTDERPGLSRELPNWMFDESYCIGMVLGPPQISIEGLNQLADVLASLGKNRGPAARSRSSATKERGDAEKPVSKSSAARSRAGKAKNAGTLGTEHGGTDRDLGRSSAGSPERRCDEDGR
jgi:hypothetical protein